MRKSFRYQFFADTDNKKTSSRFGKKIIHPVGAADVP